MAEELILTEPIQPPAPAATTRYRVSAVTMDLETIALPLPPAPVPPPGTAPEPGLVLIKLKDDAGKSVSYQYTGHVAVNIILTLNTANLSTESLQKRILERLSADGFVPGTVQGTPDAASE